MTKPYADATISVLYQCNKCYRGELVVETPISEADGALLDRVNRALSKHSALFADITPDFISDMSVKEYGFGEIIFSEKKCEKALGLIVSGGAVAKKKRADSEVVMSGFSEGDIFGAAALYSDSDKYTSEISSLAKHTEVLFIPQRRMTELFSVNADAAIAYIVLLSNKIRYLNDKIDSFTSPNAFSKLCRYLCENNSTKGIPMQTLAKVLDMSRMTLYRNLEILVSCGAVRKDGKEIVVIDRSKLCE